MNTNSSANKMTAMVCGQWELPLIMEGNDIPMNPREGKRARVSNRSYFHFISRRASDLSKEAICYQFLCQRLGKVESALEFFGGVGMTATIISNICDPQRHILMDHSEACCRQLAAAFPSAEVHCVDSYSKMGEATADLVCLDYNTYTIGTWYKDRNQSTQKVISQRPKAIILTDSACSKLHLNAWIYEKASGHKIDGWAEYVQAWSKITAPEYRVTHAAKHNGASYILFQTGQPDDVKPELFECPQDVNGFALIK